MGSVSTKEELLTTAIENQDATELRTILKDLSADQIRALCKAYATLDENECTILHYATWQDNPEILAPLLDYADDLEIRDGFGWTPLMTAVNRGSKQNVNMLIARGAKIDCDWSGGMSLIADAMNSCDPDLVATLIDRGARTTPTAEMLVNGQDQNAFYLLHYAVDDSLMDIAKVLIEKGKIPLNTLDQSGWSPLHLAAGHNNVDMVTFLLGKGADVNVKDSKGNTPLAWAREMNAIEVMGELTRRGGVADSEWHGEKLEMKNRAEEWAAEEPEHYTENEYEQETTNGSDTGRFEIEIDDSKNKKQNSTNGNGSYGLDAIQRQRPSATNIF